MTNNLNAPEAVEQPSEIAVEKKDKSQTTSEDIAEHFALEEENLLKSVSREGRSLGFTEEEIRNRMETSGFSTRISQIKEKAGRALLSFKVFLAASLVAGGMPLSAQEQNAEHTTLQESPIENNLIVTPEELRTMVYHDKYERIFFSTSETPDVLIAAGTGKGLYASSVMTPEAQRLLGTTYQLTMVHTHPVGIYDAAGYTADQISSFNENLLPIPPSLPPSVQDLLTARRFSEISATDEPGDFKCLNQKIYGTDGIWSYEGGNESLLMSDIETSIQETVRVFEEFRKNLPAELQENYDKIINEETKTDGRLGFICGNINELAKDPLLAVKLPELEGKLHSLTKEYAQAFSTIEELGMLSIAMTHPEQREEAMRKYLSIVNKEGFQVTFEPYDNTPEQK